MPRPKKDPLFSSLFLAPTMAVVDAGTLDVHPLENAVLATLNVNALRTDPPTFRWKLGTADHLIVLSSTEPIKDLAWARTAMNERVREAAAILGERGLLLLPGGAHPFFEGKGRNGQGGATPDAYPGSHHRGRTNDQCLRLHLPFNGDDEFAKVHAAVRVLLPILPALSAASPITAGQVGPSLDMRLIDRTACYGEWPELSGPMMPEALFTCEEYYRTVFTPIVKALATAGMHDTADIHAMDSRTATASFDPDLIELKVLDGQECIGADLAIAELILVVLRKLGNGRWMSSYVQRAWHESDLTEIHLNVLRNGPQAVIEDQQYLRTFGCDANTISVAGLWEHIVAQLHRQLSAPCRSHIAMIQREGNLAQRLLKRIGGKHDRSSVQAAYAGTCMSLVKDTPFGTA